MWAYPFFWFPDSFSPAVLIDEFLKEVGEALATVICLSIDLDDAGNSPVTRTIMHTALSMVVRACPSLLQIYSSDIIPPELFEMIGGVCPQLSTITILNSDERIALGSVQEMMLQQPRLFPQLIFLALPHFVENIPDLSGSSSIRILYLCSYAFVDAAQWSRLPPNLEKLQVDSVVAGPSPLNDRTGVPQLVSLLRLGVSCSLMPLHALAQLLQAAPALRELKDGFDPNDHRLREDGNQQTQVVVHCSDMLSAAADFGVLQHRMGLESIANAVYYFDCNKNGSDTCKESVFAMLPRMPGFTSCLFAYCEIAEMVELLNVFPDVQSLVLAHVELFKIHFLVMSCSSKLTRLKLHKCNSIEPMGLLEVCNFLPSLCDVRCQGCRQLQAVGLASCKNMMARSISMIEEPNDCTFCFRPWGQSE